MPSDFNSSSSGTCVIYISRWPICLVCRLYRVIPHTQSGHPLNHSIMRRSDGVSFYLKNSQSKESLSISPLSQFSIPHSHGNGGRLGTLSWRTAVSRRLTFVWSSYWLQNKMSAVCRKVSLSKRKHPLVCDSCMPVFSIARVTRCLDAKFTGMS